MGLIGLIFLHSFNFDYTLSEVVIDRVLNYELELGKIFLGKKIFCGKKEDIEGDEARCKCLLSYTSRLWIVSFEISWNHSKVLHCLFYIILRALCSNDHFLCKL